MIAILVLFVGWLLAKTISNIIGKAFEKTDLDEKLFNRFRTSDKPINSNKIIKKAAYYLLLLVVFILFFNILNLDMIANPLSDLISTFFNFIPAVLKAALILLAAWLIATIVQWLIVKGTEKIKLQQLLLKMKVVQSKEDIQGITETTGKVSFYIVLLLFIPGVLSALNITGVAQPFSGLLESMLIFIPRLVAAALTFAVGWLVAKIVKSIVVNLLQAAGLEKLVEKLKLQKVFEQTNFAHFIGNLVFVIILIPITITALEKLALTSITDPGTAMLNDILAMVPSILVAFALVLIGIWLGKLIGNFVHGFLESMGFDNFMTKIQIGSRNEIEHNMTPSALVGYIVRILIVFFLSVQALPQQHSCYQESNPKTY